MWIFSTKDRKYIFNEGPIYSTAYHVVYESPSGKDLQKGIEQRLRRLDYSLSVFNLESTISRVNQNLPVYLDPLFRRCFKKALEISAKTEGAFDMTVSPLVNAWGFGFKNKENITPELIQELLEKIGYQKVKLHWGQVRKENPGLMLDASAIAKGLATDEVARYLRSKGCRNYMVEIGGEIVAKGVNSQNRTWRIGISKPENGYISLNQDYEAIVSISGKAIATSGNYRNFYIEGDKKYAHTIDPRTGYPVQQSVLSATVLANDCMTADAYATAFMVLGVEKSLEITERTKDLECFLIFGDENGTYDTVYSKGFSEYLA
jgi:thiamine biosynthesis lipoprotein